MLLDYYSLLYASAPVTSSTSHRYYRWVINNGGSYQNRFNISEFKLSRHATVDENYLSSGGFTVTQTDLSGDSSPASVLWDGLGNLSGGGANNWASCSRPSTNTPLTIQWDYGSTSSNWPLFQSAEFVPGANYELSYTPNDFTIDYSDDGIVWTNLITATGVADGNAHTYLFPYVPPVTDPTDVIIGTYYKMYMNQLRRSKHV